MDLKKIFNDNKDLKNGFKSKQFTTDFFKLRNRDKIEKDNLYVFQTNMADAIGKWHRLSIFYVLNFDNNFVDVINLLYIPDKVYLDFIDKGFSKNELLLNYSYSIIKIPVNKIIFSTKKDFSIIALIPYIQRNLLGIHSSQPLKNDILDTAKKELYKNKRIEISKNNKISKPEVEDKIEPTERFDYGSSFDLDALFDEGHIKLID